MRYHPHFGPPLTRFVAPQGAPPRAPVGAFACGTIPISAHPSHVSSPHRELHRGLQWVRSHAVPSPFRPTPHTFRRPTGSSTEGSSGCVRMRYHPHFGPPLTRFVAPQGAPPRAPVGAFACGTIPISAHPSHVSSPHR